MKKQLTLLYAIATTTTFAQGGPKWGTTGNATTTGDFLGTTNNFPLDFKTNNALRMQLSNTGILNINNLAGTGNRLLQTDANGNLLPFVMGTASQVLYGNGTWGALPFIPANIWQGNAASAYYMGKVGIGTSTPSVALDVVGSAQISNTLKINSLSGTATRLLQTDAYGNLIALPQGTSTQVLYGNGVWGALPTPPVFTNTTSCITNAPLWSIGGNNFTAVGSLTQAAIGTCNNSEFVLKSHGNNRVWFKQDGTISFGSNLNSSFNNTEYRFHAGALRLSGDNSFGGPMIVFDGGSIYGDWGIEYQATQFAKPGLNFWKPYGSPNSSNYQLFLADDGMIGVGTANPQARLNVDAWDGNAFLIQANGNKKAISIFNKTAGKESFAVTADGKTIIGTIGQTDTTLTVNGFFKADNLLIKNNFVTNALKFGASNNAPSISVQTLSNGAQILSIGTIFSAFPHATTCIKPYTGVIANFNKRVIITNDTTTATSNVFDFNNDGQNGFIDYGYDISLHPLVIDTTGTLPPSTPIPALKINSACWGDVELAHGGGVTSAGRQFEVGYPTRNSNIVTNIKGNGANTIGLRITTSGYPDNVTSLPVNYNTQLFVNRNRTHALSVFNTLTNASGNELFTVFGDGKMQIVTNNIDAIVVKDFVTNKENFKVKNTGFVYAREINVMPTNITFPDYVFEKNYKLMPLNEVELFVNKNKHLPNIPTAKEVEANGINISELQVKQMEKIEELYLYIIELKKENEDLKQRMINVEEK